MDEKPPLEPEAQDPDQLMSADGAVAALPAETRQQLQQLYKELRALAAHHLRGERPDHTLQPTALLHEAYLRLHHRFAFGPTDRVHLMALISRTMRRVLVDHARLDGAQKRPSHRLRVTFHDELRITDHGFEDLLDLHLVLDRYKRFDPRAARIAEWLLFGGFSQAEVAEHLGLSERTVRNEYAVAKAWLRRELHG
ncbi:MAG: ECF-type sigma factor [Candidatus Eisenbacteria bacterium]